MFKRIFLFLFLISTYALFSQTGKYPVVSLPVERNGIKLENPWSGGLNAPQFSSADLNNDGINDLFIFDRAGDKIQTYINDGSHSDTAFHYAPAYERLFPPLTIWAVIRDYNHDGIPDIFTDQTGGVDTNGNFIPAGIKVYKGSRPNGNLRFDVVQNCLVYKDGIYRPSLWANSLGLPAIVDVNHDGDLDVLTFNVFGAAVDYYENQIVEMGLPADSFLYQYTSACWGNFYVGSSTHDISLGISCKGEGGLNSQGGGERHTGSALSAFDNGDDGDVDLLVTTTHFSSLDLLNNSGNPSYANIGWVDTLFPSCNAPVHLPYFPNAFQIDGDNDGLGDLLIAPNLSPSYLDVHNVMFYKNVLSDSCHYQYQNDDTFLIHTMLDFGTDSKAVFFDYNNDGLMDIVVGNYYYYNPLVPGFSQLALYQNVGTASQPSFTEVTNNFASLTNYGNGNSFLALNPAFGDLDGDGQKDMLIGDIQGYIHFFKNTGTTAASFPAMTIPVYDSINVGGYAAPLICDMNGDSLLDLVIGKQDGSLSYYRNFGTKTSPQFHRDSVNANFGNVNVKLPSDAAGNSQPFISTDSLGNRRLFVGSYSGYVYEYLITTSPTDSFPLLTNNFLNYDAGMNVTMQAFDLNNDGKQEYIFGNSLGGLQLFSETVWDSSVILTIDEPHNENSIFVFPNPAKESFTCVLKNVEIKNVHPEVFSLLGGKINLPFSIESDCIVFSSVTLAQGMYLIRLNAGDRIYTGKVFVQH